MILLLQTSLLRVFLAMIFSGHITKISCVIYMQEKNFISTPIHRFGFINNRFDIGRMQVPCKSLDVFLKSVYQLNAL